MNTNYFSQTIPNRHFTSGYAFSSNQELKQQKPNSIWQDDDLEDDFIDGDFTKNLIISTLNNWSKQHLNTRLNVSISIVCPSVSYKN